MGGQLAAHVGDIGRVVGGFFGAPVEGWRMSYFIGGGLGLMLLALRVGVRESGMYHQARDHADEGSVARGNFFALFSNRDRFLRYLRCILIGLPTWFMIGILVQRASTVFAPANGITGEPIKDNWSVAAFYLGLTFGDLASGVGSQLLRSRKKVVLGFLLFSLACVGFYLFGSNGWSSDAYYRLIFLMGFGMGYWALFVTIAAEQFGTNLRATVATTVPNFARGSLVPLTFLFTYLAMPLTQARVSPPVAGAILGVICFGAAFIALATMEETFGKRPIPTREGGSIPIVALFQKELGSDPILFGFGLDTDALHSPNEHYGVKNYLIGIETIAAFFRHFSALQGK